MQQFRLFEPNYRIESIKPKRHYRKNGFFKHGEANRIILDSLREAGKPISINEITNAVMSSKEINSEHKEALQADILTTLYWQRRKGVVESANKDQWALVA